VLLVKEYVQHVETVSLCKNSKLTIHALEKEKAIYQIASRNIESEHLTDRIPVPGDAHELPFESEFADFIVSK
jgi:tRNA1(Val) A37 N6-methylase TrmN6